MANVTLILGDCLEKMKSIPDKSVDAVITDPPYYRIMNCEWDKQWETLDEYIDWLELIAVEWRRIIKDNGSIYLFADDKACAYIQTRLDKHFLLVNNLVWFKTNNLPIKNTIHLRSFAPMTERILFYSAQYDPTGWETVKLDMNNFSTLRQYFKDYQEALGLTKLEILESVGQKADHCFRWGSSQWDMPTEETYTELSKLPVRYKFVRREYEDLRREYEDLRRVFNADESTLDVISGPIVNVMDNTDHPTTKPLWIMERLIKVSTNPDMIVLDCFAGSGTTGVACVQTGRNFIGIEIDEGYFKIAEKRIHDAQQQMRIDFPIEKEMDYAK